MPESCRVRVRDERCGQPAGFVARWDLQGGTVAYLCDVHAAFSEADRVETTEEYATSHASDDKRSDGV